MNIKNKRLADIQKEIEDKYPRSSQRLVQTMTIARLSQEILSMELEINQWRERATKHQVK